MCSAHLCCRGQASLGPGLGHSRPPGEPGARNQDKRGAGTLAMIPLSPVSQRPWPCFSGDLVKAIPGLGSAEMLRDMEYTLTEASASWYQEGAPVRCRASLKPPFAVAEATASLSFFLFGRGGDGL